MGIYEQVTERLQEAMRARDKARTSALRNIRAALQTQAKETGADTLPDEESLAVLRRLAKQRAESIEAYDQAGRAELADAERAELAVIEDFLPKLADEETTRRWVREAIERSGAGSAKDVGKVMGVLMKEHRDEIDGKLANRLARELLG